MEGPADANSIIKKDGVIAPTGPWVASMWQPGACCDLRLFNLRPFPAHGLGHRPGEYVSIAALSEMTARLAMVSAMSSTAMRLTACGTTSTWRTVPEPCCL